MTLGRDALFAAFKYTVYVLLAMNVYWFFADEHAAAALQFANGVPFSDLIEAYAATIDTFAWVVLLLMFELETYVLDERHFTPTVSRTLKGVRIICYAFIVYAFYGYVLNLLFLDAVAAVPGLADLCTLADGSWSYAVYLDDYVPITAENCATFSNAAAFIRFDGMPAVVDAAGLSDLRGLARIDVLNSAVWLLVVFILEIDVRLQERNAYEGVAFMTSGIFKIVLYSLLLYAAIYWGVKGDFVDFWDAFLWLVAFVFIELNVFEWRAEEHAEASV